VFLDDFGTGYSSLAYLATLPIDTIKLDKLFSRSVGTSLVGTLVLREICRMMMTLGLSVIFEGIETEDQARVLEELAPGAIGQGWLFGRPVPLSELTAMHLA
jgi:sensor c-di-GMP phosphodiesterase-like protein